MRCLRMRTGILTFHRACNYGAVLQAYALQQYLSDNGIESEMIDYRCKAVEQMHSPFYFLYCKGLKNKAKQFLRLCPRSKKRKVFSRFVKENIKTSDKIKDLNGCPNYDVLIVGSDQVWNPLITNFDRGYLLDFASKSTKKTSYAASIGLSSLSEQSSAYFGDYLKSFDYISLRETDDIETVRGLSGKEPEIQLDPTLTVNKRIWAEKKISPKIDNYNLIYSLKSDKKLISRACEFSKEQKLVNISDTLKREKGMNYVPFPSPFEWIGYIADAEKVFTDSFHGTAFSLIFHKPVVIKLSDNSVNGNSRILNLLDRLSVNYKRDDLFIEIGSEANWDEIDRKIIEINKTFAFSERIK